MSYFSAFAVYFIIWWVTLFAILPFGVRTQQEEGDVTLGTTESAPANARLVRTALATTVVSAVIFGAYLVMTEVYGLSIDSIPRIVPQFRD
jgi:predicted secreted protein